MNCSYSISNDYSCSNAVEHFTESDRVETKPVTERPAPDKVISCAKDYQYQVKCSVYQPKPMPALNSTGFPTGVGTMPTTKVCTNPNIYNPSSKIVCSPLKCADGYSMVGVLCYKNVCPTGTTLNTTLNECVGSKNVSSYNLL